MNVEGRNAEDMPPDEEEIVFIELAVIGNVAGEVDFFSAEYLDLGDHHPVGKLGRDAELHVPRGMLRAELDGGGSRERFKRVVGDAGADEGVIDVVGR